MPGVGQGPVRAAPERLQANLAAARLQLGSQPQRRPALGVGSGSPGLELVNAVIVSAVRIGEDDRKPWLQRERIAAGHPVERADDRCR